LLRCGQFRNNRRQLCGEWSGRRTFGAGAKISGALRRSQPAVADLKDPDWKLAQKMAKSNGLPEVDNYAALKKVQPVRGRRRSDSIFHNRHC